MRWVIGFASLAAVAALVVVVAVIIPPTRPHTELPMILAENGTDLGELQRLGLQFGLADQEQGVGLQSPEPRTVVMSDGAVRFRGSSESLFGMDPVVAGAGSSGGGSSPVAAGF